MAIPGGAAKLHRPRVSVVMPAYNNERYIVPAVESILSQTYRDFELIVIDDGSRDNTAERIAEAARRDKRVRLISQSNTGIVGALNHGLDVARGAMIARMDSDDIAFPDRFARQLAFLDKHPRVVLLGTPIVLIDENGRLRGIRGEEFGHQELSDALMAGKSGAIMHPTIMVPRAALDRAGHYRDRFRHVEDLDLFLRLAEQGEIRNLHRPLLNYRIHGASVCHVHREEQKEIKRAVIRDALDRRGQHDRPVVIKYNHETSSQYHRLYNEATEARENDEPAKASFLAIRAAMLRPARRETWQLATDFASPLTKRFHKTPDQRRSQKTLIVQSGAAAVSETFLKAQAERLPGQVHVAYCEGVTCLDGKPALADHWLARGWRGMRRRLLRQSWDDQQAAALRKLVKKLRPNVILAQYGPVGVQAMRAAKPSRVPLVVHFHGYDAVRRSTLERFGPDYREMFQYAAGIVAVSQAMAEQLRGLGCPPEKLHVLPYGTDLTLFQGANTATAPPHFVAVGRLVEKKAPHLTLLAFARVLEHVPEATLSLIGDGPLINVCRDLVAALDLERAVIIHGAQPHDVVQREMAAARCFVQHSVQAADGDCEGTPVAILEAGASGLPVVATTHAGIPDVIQHDKTGLLVPERDVAGMAEAMLAIARDSQYAQRLGDAARRRIEEHFNLDNSITALARLLREAAAFDAPPDRGQRVQKTESSAFPLIVSISNNRWDAGLTGRQHVLSRLARHHRGMFVNPLHDLRAQTGWTRADRWKQQLQVDPSGVRVLDWPTWLGQSYREPIERPLREIRNRLLARLVRREGGTPPPILYVWHPDSWPLVEKLPRRLVCYHVYDHYELLSPAHKDRITANHEKLAARADVVICVSPGLAARFGGESDRVHVVPNGADVAHFAQTGLSEPEEIADLPRPRMMLVARLNGNYDYRLLRDLVEAKQLPLVIVGPRRGMPPEVGREFDQLLDHPLVRWVGEQPFERLPEFVSACDVGLIPYRSGTSSDFASPLKLFEYLAAGKAVVAANVESIRPYHREVLLAQTPEQWSQAVDDLIRQTDPQRAEQRRQLARDNSWDARVRRIETILAEALDRSVHQVSREPIHARPTNRLGGDSRPQRRVDVA